MVNEARLSTARSHRVEALAFHPSGWLAASTNGAVVAEVRSSGEVTAFRAATRSITALSFFNDGTALLVGGAERNLRVWPVDIVTEAVSDPVQPNLVARRGPTGPP